MTQLLLLRNVPKRNSWHRVVRLVCYWQTDREALDEVRSPCEDINTYVEFAKSKGMEIKYVLDTQVQADHLSGGLQLAQLTGAEYCLHGSADVSFDFTAVTDNQDLDLANVGIRVLHTLGHTLESISLLVTDRTRGPEPWFLLTGDTLFVDRE